MAAAALLLTLDPLAICLKIFELWLMDASRSASQLPVGQSPNTTPGSSVAKVSTAKASAVQAQMRATRTDITVRQFIDEPQSANGGDMRVSELLTELEGQSHFIHKVIALVSGIQTRQSERISE